MWPSRANGSAVLISFSHGSFPEHLTIVLCNLVPVRLILVKIVLPVEAAPRLDLAIQSQGSSHRRNKSRFLEMGLATRKSDIEEGNMRICFLTGRSQSIREELPRGIEPCMNLDSNGQFPLVKPSILDLIRALGGRRSLATLLFLLFRRVF